MRGTKKPVRTTTLSLSSRTKPVVGGDRRPDLTAGELTLDRLARMVATGQVALPTTLSDGDLRIVVELVREHRQQQLLRHIARCIALDILSSGSHKQLESHK